MQKQLRIVTRSCLSVCPLSSGLFQVPLVPPFVFSRHFSRLPVHFRPFPGIKVRQLANGWFVWCYPSGRRMLSVLPF